MAKTQVVDSRYVFTAEHNDTDEFVEVDSPAGTLRWAPGFWKLTNSKGEIHFVPDEEFNMNFVKK